MRSQFYVTYGDKLDYKLPEVRGDDKVEIKLQPRKGKE